MRQNSLIRLQVIQILSFAFYFTRWPITKNKAMPPITQQSTTESGLNLVLFSIPQSLLLQIGSASILMLLTTGKMSIKALESLGQASEELFRGDRLPILPFPNETELDNYS